MKKAILSVSAAAAMIGGLFYFAGIATATAPTKRIDLSGGR